MEERREGRGGKGGRKKRGKLALEMETGMTVQVYNLKFYTLNSYSFLHDNHA